MTSHHLDSFLEGPGVLRQVTPAVHPLRHPREAQRWTCPAFPAGILGAILCNEHDHRLPYPGDHGIRFALIPADVVR